MGDDSSEISEQSEVNIFAKEFGEIPPGTVSVFITIPKEKAEQIAKEGLKIVDSPREEIQAELENLFSQEADRQEIGIKRTECIYAYPRHPVDIHSRLNFEPTKELLIEALIDPKESLVTEGEYYTTACELFNTNDKANALEYADAYWRFAVPLGTYISDQYGEYGSGHVDFIFPEVLIPHDIPPGRIRVAKVQPEW